MDETYLLMLGLNFKYNQCFKLNYETEANFLGLKFYWFPILPELLVY
jgi:hypothetical protein